MLFAGWEVRIVKNCDRVQHFQARGHSFSRTDPRPANNMFIFFPAVNWFTDHKWVCLRNFVIESARATSTSDL